MKRPTLSAAVIMDAAARCNLNRIRQLLADGAKPEHLMTKSANAVTEACFGWWGGYDKGEKKRLDVVRELVAAGCRVEGLALFRPIDRGELELVRFLIEHGADVNVIAPKEYYTGVPKACTPLGVAIQSERAEVVAELIRGGANVHQHTGAKYGLGVSYSSSPIVKAASRKQPAIIRMLVEAGADPNVCDPGDYFGTALITAIAFNQEEVVKELVAAGADVNQAAGKEGSLPLAFAKEEKRAGMVKILENAKAAIPKKYGAKEGLGKAAKCGDIKAVKQLLAKRADPNARCSFEPGNPTSLSIAAENGHTKVVELLLKAGAKHDAVDSRRAPALFYAASEGHADVIRVLLAAGAEVDVQVSEPYEGMVTPLVMAAEGGHLDAVKALLAAGANVRHRSRSGKTALTSAAAEGHSTVVAALITAVTKTEKRDRAFDTPLWWAVFNGHVTCVKHLLAARASPQATGLYKGKSKSALDLARKPRKSKILSMLNSASKPKSR